MLLVRVGDEIQKLQRFVQANSTAIKKLLKKYRRWTNSPDLGSRFSQEVLNPRNSFLANDYSTLVERYTEVLTSCRDAWHSRSQANQPPRAPNKGAGTAEILGRQNNRGDPLDKCPGKLGLGSERLFSVSQNGPDVEFDSVLATVPLGVDAGRATYWVHQDNLIALRILLLEHTNNRSARTRPPVSAAASRSSISSLHKQVLSESSTSPSAAGDEVNLAIFDDLDEFSRKQSSATVGDIENATGTVSEKATVSARWSNQTEAAVTLVQGRDSVSTAITASPPSKRVIKTAPLKRKNLRALFDIGQPVPKASLDASVDSDTTDHLADMRDFIASNSRIAPLVQIRSKRNRFVGLHNQANSGLWATLDTDVVMSRIDLDAIGTSNATTPVESSNKNSFDVSAFPHGILEVRWEGGYSTDLVQSLDQSHLVSYPSGDEVSR
jgi:hypothetical protein